MRTLQTQVSQSTTNNSTLKNSDLKKIKTFLRIYFHFIHKSCFQQVLFQAQTGLNKKYKIIISISQSLVIEQKWTWRIWKLNLVFVNPIEAWTKKIQMSFGDTGPFLITPWQTQASCLEKLRIIKLVNYVFCIFSNSTCPPWSLMGSVPCVPS